MYFNKPISKYSNYYNDLFMRSFHDKNTYHNFLYIVSKKQYSFIVTYPIFNKTVIGFRIRGNTIKRRRMKNRLNINQTIFLNSSASVNRFFLTIPIRSNWFRFS